MIGKKVCRGHALGIVAGIIVLNVLLAYSAMAIPGVPSDVHITTMWDEAAESPLLFTWNYTNFHGFNMSGLLSGLGTENLTVLQTDLRTNQRTINKSNLVYTTTALPRKLKVVEALNLIDNAQMQAKGLGGAYPGGAFDNGTYYMTGWGAENYVTIKGKVNKLSKLIFEQDVNENMTLAAGESWDVGDGWTLTANSIDAKASPRQVWITLSKDGAKKDDKVITSGGSNEKPIYTYDENLCGETDVPVFVTYVNNISKVGITDMVELKYTWLTKGECTEIKSGDRYGLFNVTDVSGNTITLKNSVAVLSLLPDAAVMLFGRLNFKVNNSATRLKFYPTVDFQDDIIPPASVTNLTNTTYEGSYINWIWTDPADPDFSRVRIIFDGSKVDVPRGVQHFNATGLRTSTLYNISTRTLDNNSNINLTWVNSSVRTADNICPAITFMSAIDANGRTVQNGGDTTSNFMTFIFSTGTPAHGFECSLDGAVFASCTSPKSYSIPAYGTHTFEVRAIDAAGNTCDSDIFTWTRLWTLIPIIGSIVGTTINWMGAIMNWLIELIRSIFRV